MALKAIILHTFGVQVGGFEEKESFPLHLKQYAEEALHIGNIFDMTSAEFFFRFRGYEGNVSMQDPS